MRNHIIKQFSLFEYENNKNKLFNDPDYFKKVQEANKYWNSIISRTAWKNVDENKIKIYWDFKHKNDIDEWIDLLTINTPYKWLREALIKIANQTVIDSKGVITKRQILDFWGDYRRINTLHTLVMKKNRVNLQGIIRWQASMWLGQINKPERFLKNMLLIMPPNITYHNYLNLIYDFLETLPNKNIIYRQKPSTLIINNILKDLSYDKKA